jgi:hypothetical protein
MPLVHRPWRGSIKRRHLISPTWRSSNRGTVFLSVAWVPAMSYSCLPPILRLQWYASRTYRRTASTTFGSSLRSFYKSWTIIISSFRSRCNCSRSRRPCSSCWPACLSRNGQRPYWLVTRRLWYGLRLTLFYLRRRWLLVRLPTASFLRRTSITNPTSNTTVASRRVRLNGIQNSFYSSKTTITEHTIPNSLTQT